MTAPQFDGNTQWDPQADPTTGAPSSSHNQAPQHGYSVPQGGFSVPQGAFGMSPQQEISEASTANYLGLLFLAGPFGWIGPMIYRSNAGQRSVFVRQSATAALNFHISLLIYNFGALILGCGTGIIVLIITGAMAESGRSSEFPTGMFVGVIVLYGSMILISLGHLAWGITASCIGGARARRGEVYRYPGSIRFIKH